ncbi:unnamed protein product [Rotaria magnacalcarata]|nr:unnamed protein product [Rotaria magnacalcarata]
MEKQIQQTNNDIDSEAASLRREDNLYKIRNNTEECPDYYETIEHPIDMSIIKDKMNKGIYKREQDIVEDLSRMFNNAKVYNVDESYIFKYASRLEQALSNKYKTMIIKKERPSHLNRISTKK